MEKIRERIIVHPILFGISPILSLYVSNLHVHFGEVFSAIFLVVVLVILTWILIRLLVKSWDKSAIFVSILVSLLFSYAQVLNRSLVGLLVLGISTEDAVQEASYLVPGRAEPFVLLIILIAVFWALITLLKRFSLNYAGFTRFLNLVALILFSLICVNGLLVQVRRYDSRLWMKNWRNNISENQSVVQEFINEDHRPDIYYIVLDGYGREDILRAEYKFDNSEFLAYLSEQGFYVAQDSMTNYSQTMASLSSSLNFMYLEDLIEFMDPRSDDIMPLQTLIEYNRVFQALKNYGYSITSFSTGYALTELPNVDYYESPQFSFGAFHNEVINLTPGALFLRGMQYGVHRERIRYVFDHLVAAGRNERPDFIFAHLLIPHPPFVFTAEGDSTDPGLKFVLSDANHLIGLMDAQEYRSKYSEQITYLNRELQEIIGELLDDSLPSPMIVLQADHGPGATFNQEDLSQSNLPERMYILNAYYFPEGNYGSLYPSISPVNSFRVILNTYFGEDHPLLHDRSFFVPNNRPYSVIDVTSEIVH